jgi:hypothetical protein
MSSVSIQGNASGTGIFTIASPNSNTNRTLTLPDSSGTLALAGSSLTGVTESASPFETALGTGAGIVNTGVNNTFIGYEAGNDNTTGTDNTSVGYQALDLNTTGTQNTAVGSGALGANTTNTGNTAVGYQALLANTANNNTGVGRNALGSNTTGTNNTGVGFYALVSNTTGGGNTALGNAALESNSTGTENTAVGYQALDACTTGERNTAVGLGALGSVTTSIRNTAVGAACGDAITTGSYNTMLGNRAGNFTNSVTTGSQNTHIGYATGNNSSGDDNCIVIAADPDGTTGKGSNTGFINANGGGNYAGNNSSSWSTTSDQRLKKNIVDNTEGLEKVNGIRVRNFEYRLPDEVDPELNPTAAIKRSGVQLGVIAQELQQVCPDCVKEETTGVLSVDSDNIFWHMVNAIKELNAKVETLEAQNAAFEARLAALENK